MSSIIKVDKDDNNDIKPFDLEQFIPDMPLEPKTEIDYPFQEMENLPSNKYEFVEDTSFVIKSNEEMKREIIDRFTSEANKKAKEIEDRAYNKGYNEGMTNGFNKGLRDADEALTPIISASKGLLDNLLVEKEKAYKGFETEFISLVMIVAKKVVKREIKIDRNVIVDVFKEAVKGIYTHDKIKVYMNSTDLKNLKEHEGKLLNEIRGYDQIEFVEDNHIESGGCKIESNVGNINSKIDIIEKEIEKILITDENRPIE